MNTKQPDIVLHGRIPSKKNSKKIKWSFRKRRKVIVPSDSHLIWHENATIQILKQSPKKHCGDVKGIEMAFWMPDDRASDLTNKAESVMDLLVDNDILIDDSWQIVPYVLLKVRGIDRKDPRVLIWIS
ncbi:hypothetical protein [Sulfuricurvum sp.]|uniref:hypothetical protein n=1 Tax=Sulfuricurvum sp. TaxID=2025608 RepID=UPI00356220B1